MPRSFMVAALPLLVATAVWLLAAGSTLAQPAVSAVSPGAVRPGATTELTLTGQNLADPLIVWTSFPAKVEVLLGEPTSRKVKLTLDVTNGIENKNVLLVEDIIDTGLTMDFLRRTLMARKPKNLWTSALLFKPKAMKADFKPDFVGFEVGNEFVVGYGLDYQGYYRNLPYIAQVTSLN